MPIIGPDTGAIRSKSPDVTASVVMPDITGTKRDAFDGGSVIDEKSVSTFIPEITLGEAEVHLFVDLSAMASADDITIEVKQKVDGTNLEVIDTLNFINVQSEPIKHLTYTATFLMRLTISIQQDAGVVVTIPTRSYAKVTETNQ